MASAKSWVKAARLRTLPLASSGIIVGSAAAVFFQQFDLAVFMLALLTAIALQVFSNFANDYGDFQKGTDNAQRLGPTRTMQGGEITENEMKLGMAISIVMSVVFGIALIVVSGISWGAIAAFVAFGLLCLLAAYFYTAGNHSYGYVGLGDVSVFIFFGMMSVSALYYLYAHEVHFSVFLLAITVGCFSTGVLNLNNMRDRENDISSGKITVASRLGVDGAKFYQAALIIGGWCSALLFAVLHFTHWWQFIFCLAMPFFFKDLIHICRINNEAQFDPFLKKLSLATLFLAVLLLVGCLV